MASPGSGQLFAERCAAMAASPESGLDAPETYWGALAERMLDQVAGHPNAPLFSTDHYLLDVFGGAALQPDRASFCRPLAIRGLRRWERWVRRRFGYGRLADALVKPFSDGERTEYLHVYARAAYENAVRAGAALHAETIKTFDISAPPIFGEQRVDLDGRPLTWWTVRAVRNAEMIAMLVGSGHRVLEIGGGNGELARVLLATGVARQVVMVDIPPALAVAQEVLHSAYPGRVSFYVPGRRTVPRAPLAVALTPGQLPLMDETAALGLVLNLGSWQEMSRRVAEGYLAHVRRLRPEHVVSVNVRTPWSGNAERGLGETDYRRLLAPDYAVEAALAWPPSPGQPIEAHGPDYDGYQGLHFRRVT